MGIKFNLDADSVIRYQNEYWIQWLGTKMNTGSGEVAKWIPDPAIRLQNEY